MISDERTFAVPRQHPGVLPAVPDLRKLRAAEKRVAPERRETW
jgi:hypothetical protein